MELRECLDFLWDRDGYLILTHRRPDGDTLGSGAALCSALRRLGKRAHLYPNPQVTEKYLPMVSGYFAPVDFLPETVVAVDMADLVMLPEGFSGAVDLCIDHHPSNSFYATKTLLWPARAACGEVILELVEGLSGGITREEADLLYTAVSTDTGCFVYANTNADTFRAVARLLDAGARSAALNQLLFRRVSPARLKLESLIYDSIRTYRDGKVVVATVTLADMAQAGATENDCDDLAALAGRVNGHLITVTIRETRPGESKISVRSGPEINASQVCARYGGGGHAMAAGCTIRCTPGEAVEKMLRAIDEVWQ